MLGVSFIFVRGIFVLIKVSCFVCFLLLLFFHYTKLVTVLVKSKRFL